MKYESPTSYGSKDIAKVKVFCKIGQRSWSRSLGQKSWYYCKGSITRNKQVNYECPTSYGSKDMAKVKFFQK